MVSFCNKRMYYRARYWLLSRGSADLMSGADRIPPLGFDKSPTVVFVQNEARILPTASTCDLTL